MCNLILFYELLFKFNSNIFLIIAVIPVYIKVLLFNMIY